MVHNYGMLELDNNFIAIIVMTLLDCSLDLDLVLW